TLGDSRYLLSFPTRRSSDLAAQPCDRQPVAGNPDAHRHAQDAAPQFGHTGQEAGTPGDDDAGREFFEVTTLIEPSADDFKHVDRSEEHTSELQSRENLVCRL